MTLVSRSSQVKCHGGNRKPTCGFLLVANSNNMPMMHH